MLSAGLGWFADGLKVASRVDRRMLSGGLGWLVDGLKCFFLFCGSIQSSLTG